MKRRVIIMAGAAALFFALTLAVRPWTWQALDLHKIDAPAQTTVIFDRNGRRAASAGGENRTSLSAEEFSRRMHAIEDDMGRVRTVRNGPRTIDIDLVDFGGLVMDTPELTLPHPRAAERDFVCRPLAELGIALGS